MAKIWQKYQRVGSHATETLKSRSREQYLKSIWEIKWHSSGLFRNALDDEKIMK